MKTLKTEDDIDIDYEDVKPKICEESGENKSVSNSVADSSIGTKIGQNKLLSNEDPFKNNDFTSPEIKVQAQIDTHCTTKIHMTRLRSTKRHLFEEEEFINEHKIPDTASEDNFVQVPGKVCDKKLVKLSDAYANYTEASTSRTKTVEKSFNDFGVYKENGEIRKGKKKTDFCFYCKTSVLNFARHITRNHSCEFDVQKIMSKPSGSIERRLLLDLLRNKARDLLPCDNCLGFFSKKLLWRHRNKCNDSMNRNHQGAAQNILLGNLSIDAHLKNTVFPSMRADEISLIAKKDPLICAYGARYIKVHREKHFINVASRKMREIARLLMELKKMEPTIKCLFDALKPKYFDTIVMATKAVSKYNVEKDKFDSPTYALNMGTYLKQCTEIAIEFALKRKQIAETVPSAEAEGDLKTLIKVIESQWQYEISSQAASDLNMSKWNKK
ncbi:hypothetical protein JTB14_000112 [Gonioctena quinquepunctata]|nr:hypothetical protein JTB14_000112 [Gonioctena quinquepunctata]